MKFKVGDRVVTTGKYWIGIQPGQAGTVSTVGIGYSHGHGILLSVTLDMDNLSLTGLDSQFEFEHVYNSPLNRALR